MRIDVVVGSESLAYSLENQVFDPLRLGTSALVERFAEEHVLLARQRVRHLLGKYFAQSIGDGIFVGSGHHIGRRALQHHNMGSRRRHCRNQSHRCCARTDDDDTLPGIVEIFGPFLRMDHRAGERLETGQLGGVPTLVAVVTRAHEQEIAGELDRCSRVLARRGHRPARSRRVPTGCRHLMLVADVSIDAELGRRFVQVSQNRRTIGDRFRLRPRLERETESVHVAVGANPGIPKQIPRAAEIRTTFEDGVRVRWAHRLQVIGGADS